MAHETFFYPETNRLLTLLDEAAQRSAVSRGRAFEDWLHMAVCALSGGALEDQYLAIVKKHSAGKRGQRGCDSLAALFGAVVAQLEETRGAMKDVLGDLFQGAVTYNEAGQFLTPESVCRLTAQLTAGDVEEEAAETRRTVCDPCCGSGRMLLAVAEMHPHWEFIGQDVDLRCVRMTAINLALRNLYGYVVHGNSLALERKLVYRTGFNGRGFVREIPLDACPAPVQKVATEPLTAGRSASSSALPESGESSPEGDKQQLFLF